MTTSTTVVTTFDGTTAFKRDCRFIKGEFYIKNKQCFEIGGTWYRSNSGFIAYDHEEKKWVVIKDSPNLIKGLVGYDPKKKEMILGYFTSNPYTNVPIVLSNGNTMTAICDEIIPNDIFVEDCKGLKFVHKDLGRAMEGEKSMVGFANNGYPFQLQYCLKHYDRNFVKKFEEGANGSQRLSTNIARHCSVLGDMTFGFEFETSKGKIPNYGLYKYGIVPLRDGSISGIEYATVVLKGSNGIKVLENACEALKKYTIFGINESLHLHLGGFKASKELIGYLYTLCCILEDDVYSIFPAHYYKTSLFKGRQKDYNLPLRRELVSSTPTETFDNISYYLSAGKRYAGFGANHPSDPDGQHKWGINERYHWVNFIPLLFGSNSTLEFRCHVPTRDPIKAINWLYICAAIIKYATKAFNSNVELSSLRKLTLIEVVNSVYSANLATYLSDYIRKRKMDRKSAETSGDYSGITEINNELKDIQMYKDISF